MIRTPCNQIISGYADCEGSECIPESQCEKCPIYNPRAKTDCKLTQRNLEGHPHDY